MEALIRERTGRLILLPANRNRSFARLSGGQHPSGQLLTVCRLVFLHLGWNGVVPVCQCVIAVGHQEVLVVHSAQPTLLLLDKEKYESDNEIYQ